MNRQIQISKFIKSNRRKRGVRPTRWGTNNGACGDVNDGSSDSSNRTDHLEVDMQKQMKYIKRARLERRKAMIDLQRRNSDSSSENIPSEREVPPDVVSDESEDEQSSSDTSSNRSVSSVELSAASVQSPCSPLDIYAQGNSEIDVETGTGQDSVSRSSGVSNSDQSNYESDTSGNFGIEDFAKDWSLIQMGHHCSNQVADAFFKYAVLNCEKIKQLKDDNKGKIPDLSHLRRRLNLQFVPGVKMDFKFYDRNLPTEERATHPVEIFNVDSKPNRRYPMDKYDLIYQVSKVEPKDLITVHMTSCPRHERPTHVILSVDGVAETKSSRRSLEVVSLQFVGCKEVYPCLILRPEVDQKKESKDAFDAYFAVFLEELSDEGLQVDKAVGDAPERANLRKQKLYGGYSSCDLCLANPENIRNERGTGSKRVFRPYMRFSERRNHEKTLEWAEEVEAGLVTEKNGIMGKSVLFQISEFDIVQDLLPEAMHLLDGGFMKNTCGRTFNQGKSPQTKAGYRRAPVTELSEILRNTKLPSDFPRRSREYDFSNYKCHEWRQMGLLMFPVIVNVLGPGYGSEKSVFLSFGFMNRAVRMPDEEYKNIEEDMFVDAENILNEHYEKAFGQTAGSYNYHISSSHLRELRRHGPLTEYTAYPFEGMYAEMRKCYAPGTPNISKQILQKLLMRKFRGHENCGNPMKPIRPNSTSKARDDLVYIYKEKQYSMYQVLEILDDNYYDCVELNIEEKIFTRHASLNFGKVGVFKYHGLTTIKRNIHIEEINGKVVMNQNLLMTVPMNVLTQV